MKFTKFFYFKFLLIVVVSLLFGFLINLMFLNLHQFLIVGFGIPCYILPVEVARWLIQSFIYIYWVRFVFIEFYSEYWRLGIVAFFLFNLLVNYQMVFNSLLLSFSGLL